MTPDRWRRVKEIFSAASELPDAERCAYLGEACRGDVQMLAEVESLLDAHAKENAIVDRPAVAHVTGDLTVVDDPWLGRRIGAYEIVALIGRGGMGEVYRARRVDAEYEKEVAVKLVPGGYHADFVLQRFRAERQILANLEHPNIARLIDGGATDEGSPYLVMELVAGEPIDLYCAERTLSVRERLRLFRDVCAAVSYAHQRLVVHRDLKPGNMLVTADGTVKLLDFGIAKLLQPGVGDAGTAPTVLTALTPGFSSPEQILGLPITTASDVYSLGVVLYRLLTGRSPYRTTLDTAQDAIREICETEPPRPSEAVVAANGVTGERVDRDLDAIILQALRKEPERRYASVEQLSEDVRRYLEGLPVRVRGDEVGYRTRKFMRRHKLEIAAAVLVAVTLVGGTVVSLREARIAAREAQRAEVERQRAERHFASVRDLANAFMFEVHDAIEALPGSTAARELLVNTALEYLNTLAAEAGRDRGLQEELAAAYEKVGNIQGQAYSANTGEPRAAIESYGKAIALLESIADADPENRDARDRLAELYLQQSRLLMLVGDTEGAKTASARSIAMYEALTDVQPDAATRRGLSHAHTVHAHQLDYLGAPGEVVAAHNMKAIDILEDLRRQMPDDLELASELGTAYGTMGATLTGADPRPEIIDEALAFHRKALELDERNVAATEGRNADYIRDLFADLANVAHLSNAKGDYVAAVENARAALAVLSRLDIDANNAQLRFDRAQQTGHLGRALLGLGEVAEAAAILEENAKVLEEIARESDTLQVQYTFGETEQRLGTAHSLVAMNAESDPATRLEHWRLAKSWYERATPRFELVASNVTLDHLDQVPIDEAIAGLARATAEIAALEAANPTSSN